MTLTIAVSGASPLQFTTDMLVVGVPQGATKKGVMRDLTKALGKGLNKALKRSEFAGKLGQSVSLDTVSGIKAGRLMLVGLGDGEVSHPDVRRIAAKAAREATRGSLASLAIALPATETAERAAAEGAVFGAYRYEAYKTGDQRSKFPLQKVSLLTTKKVNAALRAEAAQAQAVAEAILVARDLVNMPPNDLYPEEFANRAKELCKQHATHSCTVFGPKQLAAKGMNLLMAVGQGSTRGPRLIHMKYRPPGSGRKPLKKLVFVGKGLTFDAGGLCIKPAPGMDDMKGDMGGAANVMALMGAIAVLQPNAEIHGIIASAENMPGGNAYRPADIFKSYEGKTVEIINTDAEGRLALADALAYACELEPDFILDNATLTGACIVALGPTVSGFWTNRDDLADKMRKAADDAGEALWQMPLPAPLRDMLKSPWADIKHVGERWGGAITAAMFLQAFIGDTPWIHVDVAGPSMASKDYDIYTKGGTGAGVLAYLKLVDALIADGAGEA